MTAHTMKQEILFNNITQQLYQPHPNLSIGNQV
ncbi:hypothetical protein MOVI109754_04220 [Moritella viscosa]